MHFALCSPAALVEITERETVNVAFCVFQRYGQGINPARIMLPGCLESNSWMATSIIPEWKYAPAYLLGPYSMAIHVCILRQIRADDVADYDHPWSIAPYALSITVMHVSEMANDIFQNYSKCTWH
jgi:hypothetical protein